MEIIVAGYGVAGVIQFKIDFIVWKFVKNNIMKYLKACLKQTLQYGNS